MQPAPRSPTIRQAAILVGGLGTRLGVLTANIPKPLMTCGDRPFLAWLLRELCRFGVEEVLLLTGHLSEAVEEALPSIRARLPKPMQIACVREPAPAGTGGALVNARVHLEERFILCNGDSWLDFNLARALAARADDPQDVLGRMILHPLADASRYGLAELSGDAVTGFHERPVAGPPGLINAGIYLLDRRVVDAAPPVCSLERHVLPRLAEQGALRATVADGYFVDIGIPADLARAQADLPARLRRRAVFLERDAVVHAGHGLVGAPGSFEFLPDAIAEIRAAVDAGWHVFVTANQSGILDTEEEFASLTRWISDAVRREGGNIDDLRYGPAAPETPPLEAASEWRKPAPAVLEELRVLWELDPARCLIVDDRIAGGLLPEGDLAASTTPHPPG